MSLLRNVRRSTSALLYDENQTEKEAVLDQQPLLGYTDIDDSVARHPFYRRIHARYGSFRFIH